MFEATPLGQIGCRMAADDLASRIASAVGRALETHLNGGRSGFSQHITNERVTI